MLHNEQEALQMQRDRATRHKYRQPCTKFIKMSHSNAA